MATVSIGHIEKVSDAPARLVRLPRIRVAQIVMDLDLVAACSEFAEWSNVVQFLPLRR